MDCGGGAQAPALVRQALVLYPLGHLHSSLSRALHLWISQDVKVREEGAALIAPDILFLTREVSVRMGLLKNLNRCWDYTPSIFFFCLQEDRPSSSWPQLQPQPQPLPAQPRDKGANVWLVVVKQGSQQSTVPLSLPEPRGHGGQRPESQYSHTPAGLLVSKT